MTLSTPNAIGNWHTSQRNIWCVLDRPVIVLIGTWNLLVVLHFSCFTITIPCNLYQMCVKMLYKYDIVWWSLNLQCFKRYVLRIFSSKHSFLSPKRQLHAPNQIRPDGSLSRKPVSRPLGWARLVWSKSADTQAAADTQAITRRKLLLQCMAWAMLGGAAKQAAEGREIWKSKFDFGFAYFALTLGFQHLWRFPYLMYKNGGGNVRQVLLHLSTPNQTCP